MILAPEVFLDTSYLIALAVGSDAHHDLALRYAAIIKGHRTKVVTTEAILLELGSAFAKIRYRDAALAVHASLRNDAAVSILPLTGELLSRAWQLFAERGDKEWSVTDCLSFNVMNDLGIVDALTTDVHYEQAGFRALLRDIP